MYVTVLAWFWSLLIFTDFCKSELHDYPFSPYGFVLFVVYYDQFTNFVHVPVWPNCPLRGRWRRNLTSKIHYRPGQAFHPAMNVFITYHCRAQRNASLGCVHQLHVVNKWLPAWTCITEVTVGTTLWLSGYGCNLCCTLTVPVHPEYNDFLHIL